MRAPWKVKPEFSESRAAIARVVLGVLAVKAYTLILLYLFSQETPVRRGYEPFIYLADGQKPGERLEEVERSFLERLSPYDGQFYLDLAKRGYRVFKKEVGGKEDPGAMRGPGGNYAFFPLLPLILRSARALLGHQGALAVVLALNVAFSTAAAVGLHALARRIGAPPWTSVLLLLAFPTAVFQSALYTESLFLALSVGVALAASSGRFSCGAALGYLAGLTRPQGILASALWAPRLRRRPEPRGPARWSWRAILALAAPLGGLATFSAVLWLEIGAPLGFLGIQRHWAREFSPGRLLEEVLSPWSYQGPPFDHLAFILGVGLIPWLWRRLPPALALYGTLSVLLPLSTGTMLSFGRFLSVSFPHFLCLAKLLEGYRVATAVLLGGSIVLQCLLAKGLVGWYFVG